MSQSFFTGLSGMLSFSKNLDNVSNNVANLNTPGFKASDTFYRSLTSGDSAVGTQVFGQENRFTAGDIRQTGNSTDLAISGSGFFVLLDEGEARYTRAGQFTFNSDGYLVDVVTGSKVAALNEGGSLSEVHINDHRVLSPTPSTSISFKGNLSTDVDEFLISEVDIFNTIGEKSTYSISFAKDTSEEAIAGSWLVEIRNSESVLLDSKIVRFSTDGTPVDKFNSLEMKLSTTPDAQLINLEFGDPEKFNNSTSVSGGSTSTLAATVDDGYGLSNLTTVEFTSDGMLQYSYENGEKVDGATLALASFTNLKNLELDQGSIFKSTAGVNPNLGSPGVGGLGRIIVESIELSNVDLSREFADMIVIQRGYQASSRILNVSNELIDQLYESTRG